MFTIINLFKKCIGTECVFSFLLSIISPWILLTLLDLHCTTVILILVLITTTCQVYFKPYNYEKYSKNFLTIRFLELITLDYYGELGNLAKPCVLVSLRLFVFILFLETLYVDTQDSMIVNNVLCLFAELWIVIFHVLCNFLKKAVT